MQANYVLVRAWPTRVHPGDVDGGEAWGGSGADDGNAAGIHHGDDDAEVAVCAEFAMPTGQAIAPLWSGLQHTDPRAIHRRNSPLN